MIIGIFSDAHGDLNAIHLALQALQSAERIYYLGDVHEFVPQVKDCIDLLRVNNVIAVRGNCDRHGVIGDNDGRYRRWLMALPKEYTENSLVFVHVPKDPSFAFSYENFNICFCGHTHTSFLLTQHGQESLLPGFPVTLRREVQYIVGIGSVSRPRMGENKVAALFNTTTLELQLIKL